MREKLNSLPLAQLREIAKANNLKGISGLKKAELIDRLMVMAEEQNEAREAAEKAQRAKEREEAKKIAEAKKAAEAQKIAEAKKAAEAQKTAEAKKAAGDGKPEENRNGADAQNTETAKKSTSDKKEKTKPARGEGKQRNQKEEKGRRNQNQNRKNQQQRNRKPSMDAVNENKPVKAAPDEQTSSLSGEKAEAAIIEAVQTADAEISNEAVQQQDSTENKEAAKDVTQETADSSAQPAKEDKLDSGVVANGILEVMTDGFGFIRSENYMPGENDIYVAPSQIKKFGLRTGDILTGRVRVKTQNEKFSALLRLERVNGVLPSEVQGRRNFEDLTPVFPNERLRLERPGEKNMAMRVVDIISPIGKGQRGMIVSPPKAGKTTLLKGVAHSLLKNNPEVHIMILLIDERPEEVTDIREDIVGDNVDVIYSTFDELPEHHKRVSEMVIERAKRLVEMKKDVVILLDSITRLARAYNLLVPPSGRTLSGGLDPAALYMPKRFFGAARNIREGGSLTILATALVDTGSKMDDVVYEEFKGTGNMELILDRKLQEKRVFPAIDISKSGTRRDDLLLTLPEQDAAYIIHKATGGTRAEESTEKILDLFTRTRTNMEFIERIKINKYL